MKIFSPVQKKVGGIIELPSSKSISNRLLLIQKLCDRNFEIFNLSNANDCRVLEKCLENEESLSCFDVQDAGTALRFLMAYFSLSEKTTCIYGSDVLMNRPMDDIINALQLLGKKVGKKMLNEKWMYEISGNKIDGGYIKISASKSSQFVSALMLIAPVLKHGLTIEIVGEVASAPYIQMTKQLMERFGIVIKQNENQFIIEPQRYQPIDFIVESDWSAAAFFYEIAALSTNCSLRLTGLLQNSIQGDSYIAKIFEKLGVQTMFTDGAILLKKSNIIADFIEVDFTNFPDLFPAVFATCCGLNVKFRFSGLQNLVYKESDRLQVMLEAMELCGFNAKLDVEEPVLEFNGVSQIQTEISPVFSVYNDHRIAMALVPLSIVFKEISIDKPLAVSKSYPSFFNHLRCLGFVCSN
jgi:3-phosphoshikimate 1-carboxyvinyltransferase